MAPQEGPFTRRRAGRGRRNVTRVGGNTGNVENVGESSANLTELDNIQKTKEKLMSPTTGDDTVHPSTALQQKILLPFVQAYREGVVVKIVVGGEVVAPPNESSFDKSVISAILAGEAENYNVKGPNDDPPPSSTSEPTSSDVKISHQVTSDGPPDKKSVVSASKVEAAGVFDASSHDLSLPPCDKEAIQNDPGLQVSTGQGSESSDAGSAALQGVSVPVQGSDTGPDNGIANSIDESPNDAPMTSTLDNGLSESAVTPAVFKRGDLSAGTRAVACSLNGTVTPEDADEDHRGYAKDDSKQTPQVPDKTDCIDQDAVLSEAQNVSPSSRGSQGTPRDDSTSADQCRGVTRGQSTTKQESSAANSQRNRDTIEDSTPVAIPATNGDLTTPCQDSNMPDSLVDDSQEETTTSVNVAQTNSEEVSRRAEVTPHNGANHHLSSPKATSTTAASTSKRSGKDHTTNRYKVNGIIRRPCICSNSDECREMMAFWCQAVDEDLNCRDPRRAGYIRLPMYQPNAKTPIQLYKNALRLSFLGHLRPPGSKPSARWLATTRRKGKNTAEYVALHHFPRDFLKKAGNGLKIEFLDDDMAKNYKLSKNDKIDVVGHPGENSYFAPPCYKWEDLVSEYGKASAAAGTVMNKPAGSPMLAAREVTRDARPKILCLGMSKACVESQMDVEGYYWDILDDDQATVQQVVELVQRGILTEMDGRDLARVRAMEKQHKVDAFTVSQESGSEYDRNFHMHANFNRANFCDALAKLFNKPKFRQVALDYFWIPSGSWSIQHWGKSFFRVTLPNLVKKELLEYPPESQYLAKPSSSSRKLGYGVVYLPFCLHCVKQLIAAIDEIQQYYKVTFLYKNELEEHALWSGTSTIDAKVMQGRFGKNIAQEEIYCTFAPRDVFEAMEDEHITQEDVIEVLRGIEDFADVRMIRLTPLAKHNPRFKRIKRYEDEEGGFVSLLDPREVQRGFDSLLPASRTTESSSAPSSSEEEEEESSSDEEEVEVAPPPPIRKKAVVGRNRQTKPKQRLFPVIPSARPKQRLLPMVRTDQPKRPKKRMFEVLPDLETYCSLGLEGNEKVADYYALPERKRRRKRCDIATYHFGPEPKANEGPAPEIVPRPSLLSKLTLSFASGYDVDKFCRRRNGYDAATDTALYETTLPPTAQAPSVDDSTCRGNLMMLASAHEARIHESGDRASEDDDTSSPGYLMMLAHTSDLPGAQRHENVCRAAVESYTSILASVANEPIPAQHQ